MPFSSRKRTTPSAAPRPKALPPVRRRAWVSPTRPIGLNTSVSRVPGEDPRTSTPTTAPAGASKRTAVQPVEPLASVACPTRTPGTSQRFPNKEGLRGRRGWSVCGSRFFRGPVFGIGRGYAGVLGGEAPQGNELAVGPLSAELDQHGVLDHRVVHD